MSRASKELWLRGDDPAHRRSSDRFDPVAEGHKRGVPHELSLALWRQACREATDQAGQLNAAHAKRAFYDLVARWVAQGGRVQPDVGRSTRVSIEIDHTQSNAPLPSLLAPRVPGRDTRVAVEARELERTERAAGRSPEAAHSAPAERPGTSSVSGPTAPIPQPVRMPKPAFLAPSQSARLSSLFGVDLSRVPIVLNSPAAIGSTKAVTKDGAVHFRIGAYQPGTPDGDWLIAHELAHVAQQRGARGTQPGTTKEIEREADRAAGLAVRGRPAPLRLRAEAGVAYAFDEGEAHDNTAAIDPAVEAALKRAGQGEPLHAAVLQELGSRLGADFRHVRIHTDDVAARATEALGARAFTVGEDIFFAPNAFDPFCDAGQRLLVHELTHVAQQRHTPIDVGSVEPTGSTAEREADMVADYVTTGREVKPISATPRGIPRDVGWARRGEIPDPYGMGFNTILANAGDGAKVAVQTLASLGTSSMSVDVQAFKDLPAAQRKAILGLEQHAAGTACAGWFDLLRANDPDHPKLSAAAEREAEFAYNQANRDVRLAARAREEEPVRKETASLSPMDIDKRWKKDKNAFITTAQQANNGLSPEQMHSIFTSYWADRHALNLATTEAIRKRMAEDDFDTYIRHMGAYEEGERDAMGPGYAEADEAVARADLMFRHSVTALEFLRAAESQGKSLTIDELTQHIIVFERDFAAPMQHFAQMVMIAVPAMAEKNAAKARIKSPKNEPVKKAPVKTEPVKTEPVKTEPVKKAPVKTEPLKTEPVKTEPVKTDAVKTDAVKTEAPAPAPTVGVKSVGGAKRGPKTDPNAPHNATIRAEADKLQAAGNVIVAGGGRAKERLIPTPGGKKSGRRPDILYETPTGEMRGRNVGKVDAKGNPVPREVDALDDLNGPGGLPTDFVPYNGKD